MLATQLATTVRHTPVHMAAGKATSQAFVMSNIGFRSMLHSRKHLQARPTVCSGTLNAAAVTSWFVAGTFERAMSMQLRRSNRHKRPGLPRNGERLQKPDYLYQSSDLIQCAPGAGFRKLSSFLQSREAATSLPATCCKSCQNWASMRLEWQTFLVRVVTNYSFQLMTFPFFL